MEEVNEKGLNEIISRLKTYLNTRMQLGKLTLIEKGVLLFANLITDGLVLLFLTLAFIFLSFGFGFYISELTGNTFAGFFIVGAFYLLVALLIFLIKDKHLEKYIINGMIKKIFNNEEQ